MQAIEAKTGEGNKSFSVAPDNAVIVTLGSMTLNSCMGDNTTIAATNRDVENRGLFTLWENLSKKGEKFGHPEKFISDIDKTKWMILTTKGCPEFHNRMRGMLDSKPGGSSGAVTILDSNWEISFALYGKYYPNQADDEQVLWHDAIYHQPVYAPCYCRPSKSVPRRMHEPSIDWPVCRASGRCGVYCRNIYPDSYDGGVWSFEAGSTGYAIV